MTQIAKELQQLGLTEMNEAWCTGTQWGSSSTAEIRDIISPVDGTLIARVKLATTDEYHKVISQAQQAFQSWRMVPAPKRGEIVRQYGNKLREYKEALGKLVSYEMGKSYQEGLGEVQK